MIKGYQSEKVVEGGTWAGGRPPLGP